MFALYKQYLLSEGPAKSAIMLTSERVPARRLAFAASDTLKLRQKMFTVR